MSLEVKSLKKGFGQGDKVVSVLKGAEFKISRGETLSIVGQSGSGKSTLLSLLCGIDRPDEGEISLDGQSYQSLNEDELAKIRSSKVGIIFQNFHLIPHLNALENVELSLQILGEDNSETRAKEVLKRVGLGHRLDHYPTQLSGGEKQRVAIARSLVINPQFLLADEPSGSLDEKTGGDVISLLFELVEENNTGLILVTHNQNLAKRCQKVLSLEQGKLNEA